MTHETFVFQGSLSIESEEIHPFLLFEGVSAQLLFLDRSAMPEHPSPPVLAVVLHVCC